jgi:hypothetical protein
MNQKLVPDDFQVPELFENTRVRLRILTVNDVEKDYDAVMTSIDHLQGAFGPDSKWPSKELTLEQDLIDLGWHQKEFQKRSSFAYTVMSPDESECIGCVYIYPSPNSVYDSMVIMWVRQSEVKNGLDAHLSEIVKKWVREKWPFKNPGYPGRDIGWDEWNVFK